MSQYVTLDLLGTFQLPHPFTISSFEVKVASLHRGLKSDYPIISTNLNSQSDVLRSDCRPSDVNQSVPHRSLCSCTVQVCKTDTPWKSVKSKVKPHQYDSPCLCSATPTSLPAHDLEHHPLSVRDLPLSQ